MDGPLSVTNGDCLSMACIDRQNVKVKWYMVLPAAGSHPSHLKTILRSASWPAYS